MRATLQSPYRAEIFPDQSIYEPGSQVTGQVIFTLRRKLIFDRLVATMRGEVSVAFEMKPDTKATLGYRQPQVNPSPVEYKNGRQLFEQTVVLWSQNENLKDMIRRISTSSSDSDFSCSWGLEAGTHNFSFAFQLPEEGLFTAFDAKGSPAKIRYVIEVLTQYGDAEILRGEALIAVVCPEVLTIDRPMGKEGQAFVQTKQISKSEQLTVQLTLMQTNYLPGDAIQGEIVIHNKTKRSVKYALLNVVHKLYCFAKTPHVCQYHHEIKEHGVGLGGDKVRAGESFSYPIQLYIGALVPQINVPNCIYSEYELRLSVGFMRNSPNATVLHINVPIKIGTQITENFPSEMPIAPPAYDEILVQ